MVDPSELQVRPHCTIREAILCIDGNGKGIVLVTDEDRRLVGTITDGDVRRAVLAGRDLEDPVKDLLDYKARSGSAHVHPITAPVGMDRSRLLKLMQERSVLQIPLLDPDDRVVGLVTLDELAPNQSLGIQALIMAGGYGERLLPLTADTPKPMLPLGGRPLMELTVDKLRDAGIHKVNVATHHLSGKITEHFGDGREFGVELNYVAEDRPLGTAGALSLLSTPEEPLLVINGDIVTDVNFRAMLAYHRELDADMTVAVRQYDFQVPYGVVECDGSDIRAIMEKPKLGFFVNAGIYLLDGSVHEFVPESERFDMTDLISRLIESGRRVVSFPVREYWVDVGHPAEYEKVVDDLNRRESGA